MKVAVIAALATATVALASPVAVENDKRQGPSFPSACTSVCSQFFPVYNACKDKPTQAEWETCIQPICSQSAWNSLGPCLTCWNGATGLSTIPWWGLFAQACS
ncbi:unnamed protein product [Cutaneotrichosporon oleaginosum]